MRHGGLVVCTAPEIQSCAKPAEDIVNADARPVGELEDQGCVSGFEREPELDVIVTTFFEQNETRPGKGVRDLVCARAQYELGGSTFDTSEGAVFHRDIAEWQHLSAL